MKYFLIIKRPNGHYQISTEDGREMWSEMDVKTLKVIVEDWFYKAPSEDKVEE